MDSGCRNDLREHYNTLKLRLPPQVFLGGCNIAKKASSLYEINEAWKRLDQWVCIVHLNEASGIYDFGHWKTVGSTSRFDCASGRTWFCQHANDITLLFSHEAPLCQM